VKNSREEGFLAFHLLLVSECAWEGRERKKGRERGREGERPRASGPI